MLKKLFYFAAVSLAFSACSSSNDDFSGNTSGEEKSNYITFSYDNNTRLSITESSAQKSSRANVESLNFSVTIPTDIKKEWFLDADDFLLRLNGEYQTITLDNLKSNIPAEVPVPVDTYNNLFASGVTPATTVLTPVNMGDALDKSGLSVVSKAFEYQGQMYQAVYIIPEDKNDNVTVYDVYPVVPVEGLLHSSFGHGESYDVGYGKINFGTPKSYPAGTIYEGENGEIEAFYFVKIQNYNGVDYKCVIKQTFNTAGINQTTRQEVYDCYPVSTTPVAGNVVSSGKFKVSEENLVVTVSELESLNIGDEYTYETWLWVGDGPEDAKSWDKDITTDCTASSQIEGLDIRYNVYKGVNSGGSQPYIKVSIHVIRKN